jgi:hypothetical protein
MSVLDSELDGCPEFDADLLESAFAPTVHAPLDRHLSTCARCRVAREKYLRTNDALSAAFAIGTSEGFDVLRQRAAGADLQRTAHGRSVGSRRVVVLAAVALALLGLIGVYIHSRSPRVEWSPIGAGADVVFSSPEHAFMRSGEARFDVARGTLEIETPRGVVRAADAQFLLSVRSEGESDVKAKRVGVVVGASVLAGVVWFVAPDGNETRVAAGDVPATLGRAEAPLSNLEAAPQLAAVESVRTDRAPATEATQAAESALVWTGVVIDDVTERPISGAEVECARRAAGRAWTARATSDALGRFEAAFDVSAAAISADADAPALTCRARHADYATSFGIPGGESDALALGSGGRFDVGVVRMSRGVTIRGRVTDVGGAGVADARLFVFEDDFAGADFLAIPARTIGVTGPGGVLRIPERLGRAKRGNWILCASSSIGLGWTPLPIVAGRDHIDDVMIRIGPAFTLEVETRDELGKPVAGVGVQISPRFAPFSGDGGYGPATHFEVLAEPVRGLFSATTNAAGIARFPSLPLVSTGSGATAGIVGRVAFAVCAEHPAFERANRWSKHGEELESGATQHVVLTLSAIGGVRVTGRVVDEAGAPVSAATVRNDHGASTRTDAAGAFELSRHGERETTWKVRASADGFLDADELVRFDEWAQEDETMMVLRRALPVDGVVVDDLGQPVQGVRVTGMHDGITLPTALGGRDATTDATGPFTLTGTFAGEWEIGLIPPAPIEEWVPFVRVSTYGGTREARFVLRRVRGATASVEIDVVDADTGAPLDALDQRFVAHDPSTQGMVEAARTAGRIVANHVGMGAWRVWVQVPERPAAWTDIQVAGAPVRARIAVGRFAALAGRIDLPAWALSGEKLEGVIVRHVLSETKLGGGPWTSGAKRWAYSEVGADGAFAFDALMPGEWIVSWRGRTELIEERIVLHSSETRDVVLRPTVGARVVFRGALPATDGLLFVHLTNAEDPERKLTQTGDTSTSAYEVAVLLTPGRWEYEIEQRDHSQVGERSFVAKSVRGEFSVAAGESRTLEAALEAK